jgi:hypothetical protein
MTARFLENGEVSKERLTDTGASPEVQAALLRYVLEGIPTGDFLRALLSNDLKETLARADDTSILAVRALVRWLYNEAPAPCWGSREAVTKWIEAARKERARASS